MAKKPLISVIIPTKNEARNIVRLLRSLKIQDNKYRAEVILIDNYSRDKTVTLAKPFVDEIIIAGPERSAQRNLGANKAQGKWLLFLDADMQLTSGVIKECLQLANSKQIVAILERSIGKTFWGRAIALERNCYDKMSLLIAARFFPKDKFLKLGGFDEDLPAGEDWDLTQRFIKAGFSVVLTKNSRLNHYEPDESLPKMLSKELYYISHIQKYAQKHQKAFAKQSNLSYRSSIWFKSWRQLASHPTLTAGFLFYKLLVFLLFLVFGKRNLIAR